MTRFLEFSVLLRFYTIVMSFMYAYTGYFEDETLVYRVAHSTTFATNAMIFLAVCGALALIDLVINDLLPERFVIHRALHDRHLVNMAIAGCFAIQMWTCVEYDHSRAVLPFYAVYTFMVPLVAFADVRKRFRMQPVK